MSGNSTPGRPPFEPTPEHRKLVETLAGYGMAQEEVGILLGDVLGTRISHVTLRKYFRNELDTGKLKANAKVAEALFKKAVGPGKEGVTAAIFWMKTQAGWRETIHHAHGGDPDAPPIRQDHDVTLTGAEAYRRMKDGEES